MARVGGLESEWAKGLRMELLTAWVMEPLMALPMVLPRGSL